MKVKQFLSGTFTLILWAVGIEGVAFFYDLFFHQQATNRFWDTTYNWYPLIGGVIAAGIGIVGYAIKFNLHKQPFPIEDHIK